MKLDCEKTLKDNGLRCTAPRNMILDVLSKTNKPINAENIFNKLKNKIDEATVYRTLSSFLDAGIIRQVNLRKDTIYFELNNDHHHHMICIRCGEVEDFKENIEIEKILERIVEKSSCFKIINEHSLEMFGLCSKCC